MDEFVVIKSSFGAEIFRNEKLLDLDPYVFYAGFADSADAINVAVMLNVQAEKRRADLVANDETYWTEYKEFVDSVHSPLLPESAVCTPAEPTVFDRIAAARNRRRRFRRMK